MNPIRKLKQKLIIINSEKVTEQDVKITILDKNDNDSVFVQESLRMKLNENSPAGTVLGKLEATDKDSSTRHEFSFRKLNKIFN